jgi:hypothetical protein
MEKNGGRRTLMRWAFLIWEIGRKGSNSITSEDSDIGRGYQGGIYMGVRSVL